MRLSSRLWLEYGTNPGGKLVYGLCTARGDEIWLSVDEWQALGQAVQVDLQQRDTTRRLQIIPTLDRVIDQLTAHASPMVESQPADFATWCITTPDWQVRYAGRWLAFAGSRLVADSATFEQVYALAAAAGIEQPLVLRVPPLSRRKRVSRGRKRE